MKTILSTAVFILMAQAIFAQAAKIDLSKDPAQPGMPIYKKSNATLLQETKERNPAVTTTEAEPELQYNSDGTVTNGTYRKAAPVGTVNTATQPQMMNATQHQGNIGNMKTTSETYYDNSGRIHGTNTSIKLGK